MKKADYVTSVQHGLEHVLKHQQALSKEVNFFLEIIESGGGDPEVCLLRLSSLAKANALVSWFKDRDLDSFKHWCYVDGKLEYALFSRDPQRWFPAYLIFAPVLSDNEPLIRWFSCNDRPFDMVRANDLRTAEFHGYQALLALRGDWKTLEERCLKIIGHSPSKMKKYEIDHRFYLALARQDVQGMEAALQELTSPKVAKVRNIEQAFGFTEKLIGTHAVIYAKIAWRHGFKIKIDTPWIPQEWLPIAPLSNYLDPYEFMKGFDVGQTQL
jgi:hypothetical protein